MATEPSQLLKLGRADFVAHLQHFPSTALKILAEVSRRLRRADEVIGNLALLDLYARLGHLLIELGGAKARPRKAGSCCGNALPSKNWRR